MATVYTNTGDFLTTSSLWQDENLTLKVNDGWYQVGGFYREMRNGELLRAVICEECIITTPCGQQTAFSGGQSYPDNQAFNLGSDIGEVTITYEAFSVPDRFIVRFNDVIVSDTGYVGSLDFDFGGSNRSSFTSSLTGRIDPVTGTVYPDNVNFPDDGYPRVTFPGNGTTTFNKQEASPASAFVDVYGPMQDTAWNVILSCPVAPPPVTINVAAVKLQSDGSDCSSSSSDAFSAVAYIASDYADFVLNGAGKLVLDNTTGISFSGLETTLYDPNDANVDIVAESITDSLNGLILGDSLFSTIVNDESVLNTGSPKVTSSVSNTGTVQFSLCP